MQYNELKRLKLDSRTKVFVVQDGYRFESTYRWCVGIYTQKWCEEKGVTFELKEE